MQAVILAGGKGTRLNAKTKKIPKPMIKIGFLPVLEHQINLLKRYGIKDIFILTGYLSEVIENHFENKKFPGIKITCLKSDENIGPADRVKSAENYLTDDFLVFYGDVMLDMDLKKLLDFHKSKNGIATLTIHPNDHPYDSDLVEIDNNQQIVAFHSKPHQPGKYLRNLDNACVYIFSKKIFKYLKPQKNTILDFGKHIFPKIYKKEKLFGYNTPEYIKDMGTPERLKQVTKDYLSGKIKRLNIKNKRRAIFLDRDGVINYDPDNLSDINDFKLLSGAAKATKLINSSEYLSILVTNQPMVAKGFITFKDLEQIHKKMETLLGEKGAKLDGIYFCPHHPEKNFPGVPKLRIKCDCRKPKPGMIFRARKDYNIDLKKSWIIGDSQRDIEAGINAGIKTILVKKNQRKFEECQIKTKRTNNIYSAVRYVLK
ncbi:D-glycero-beta-D-manno-heptose 1,7-bisphosphate 7-phosphatase [Patescibacteria group bacterium]|nr:D-glycero-beta-D-manno-heptose 1,7-bisphosphate 7-phosphatase [Patescibacteria group bacterium]MBU2579461.1 D-glycero-beta-D-manno-heptose 1,7-bisphosphate 7-phosphatase [Patescibacteria group bacterium]